MSEPSSEDATNNDSTPISLTLSVGGVSVGLHPDGGAGMDAGAVQFPQQDGSSEVRLPLQSFTGTLRVVEQGAVVRNSNSSTNQARRGLVQNSEEAATRTTGPQKKRRKGNPTKQAGYIDDENYALLLKAMKVVVKNFLGGEVRSLVFEKEEGDEDGEIESPEDNDKDDEFESPEENDEDDETESPEENDEEDDETESPEENYEGEEDDDDASDAEGYTTNIDVLKTLRETSKGFKAVVDEELDRRIMEHKIMPIALKGGGSFTDLELSLSAGLYSHARKKQIVEKCREFIDPKNHDSAYVEDRFDYKGANKALQKNGAIIYVFEFVTERNKEEDDFYDENIWCVKFECDTDITDEAFEKLEFLLVDGSGFRYPEGYDSFGVNEFDEHFDAEEFSKLNRAPVVCLVQNRVCHALILGGTL